MRQAYRERDGRLLHGTGVFVRGKKGDEVGSRRFPGGPGRVKMRW
jgi:hypothetical protein